MRESPVRVVGVALVSAGTRGRRVLAARRAEPSDAEDRWELPGGKCDAHESLAQAAVRELREELGCTVRVTGVLDGCQVIRPGLTLEVVAARLVAGEPTPLEHDALRWLAADQLGEVGWLPADVPFLPAVAELLTTGEAVEEGGDGPMSFLAIFFEREHADAVAARLVADGFTAHVVRERLANEDDDEDHPWAVVTDAPQFTVELLVDAHDGWLDVRDP